MIPTLCFAVVIACLLASGAIIFRGDSLVSSGVLETVPARTIVFSIFFLNLAALVSFLYFFLVYLPPIRRVYLWGIYLGWGFLGASAAGGIVDLATSVHIPILDLTLKLDTHPQATAVTFLVSAVFSAHCMREYRRFAS